MSGIPVVANGKAEEFQVGFESHKGPPPDAVNIRVDRPLPTSSVC